MVCSYVSSEWGGLVSDKPIDIWRQRLEHLQSEEAKCSDAQQRFTIQVGIAEAKRKIAELERAVRGPSGEAASDVAGQSDTTRLSDLHRKLEELRADGKVPRRALWGMAGVTLLGLAAYVGRGYFSGLPEEVWNGIEMIEIPEGSFRMGSETGFESEKPVHDVHISRPFWLGKYPVTNAQFESYMRAAGGVPTPKYWEYRRFNQPEQPVVGVSWEEAHAYCQWAGGRLPTEAEWEYACRAGTTTDFSFGDDPPELEEYGWFYGNSGGQTRPVGAKRPNPWGLYDMHGNVCEWCADWFGEKYYSESPPSDPKGPKDGSNRVMPGRVLG